MNQMTFGALSAVAQVERPTRRALAKQRTREKILAAAKALFAERGYEGATVRDIAGAAGMSTGAVFASFTDKSDLFGDIIAAEHEALCKVMSDAAKGAVGKTAVEAMLDAAARRHMANLPLFQATMSALWSKELGKAAQKRLARMSPTDVIAVTLNGPQGRDRAAVGESETLAQLVWDGYIAVLRHAALGGLGLAAVRRLIRERTGIILAGAPKG